MSEALKPCWCGAKAYLNTIVREGWQGKSGVYVSCQRKSCALHGRVYSTRIKAVAAWNTRPVEDALAGALKFVQEHCQLYGAADAAREKIDAALRKAGVL